MENNDITVGQFSSVITEKTLREIWWSDEDYEVIIDDVAYQFVMIEQNGGEGEGDRADIVLQLKDTSTYFRIVTSYTSYDGFDFSYPDIEKVEPREVTVTKWFAV